MTLTDFVIFVSVAAISGCTGFIAGVLFWRNNDKSVAAKVEDLAGKIRKEG